MMLLPVPGSTCFPSSSTWASQNAGPVLRASPGPSDPEGAAAQNGDFSMLVLNRRHPARHNRRQEVRNTSSRRFFKHPEIKQKQIQKLWEQEKRELEAKAQR
ncbi:hypothetical protein FF1_029716 [Malus domestica]